MYIFKVKIFTKNKKKKVDILIQTIRIYSQDIGMEFCIEECVMLTMKRGKSGTAETMELPNKENIRSLSEKENSKY